jgi:hypothetical protein
MAQAGQRGRQANGVQDVEDLPPGGLGDVRAVWHRLLIRTSAGKRKARSTPGVVTLAPDDSAAVSSTTW